MQSATLAVPVLTSSGSITFQQHEGLVYDPSESQSSLHMSVTDHATSDGNQAQAAEVDQQTIEEDKKNIYRHPLFPLMTLLFEKCEQATQTTDCPSSDSFDVDIQAFVHHQEQDRKAFLMDEPDLDGLMLKAIQVLRIHLLELEKVTDLCKDFCQRYISCLRGKLQSENLLRLEGIDDDDCLSPTTPQPLQMITSGNNVLVQQQQQAQQTMSVGTLNQGQIISGGTVYQMVQTPQGIVAQPIQIQQVAGTPPQHVVHGSTPLSQIGVSNNSSITTPNHSQITTSLPSTPVTPLSPIDTDSDKKKDTKRGVLPKSATQIMKSWLFQHIVHPYPTEDEKRQISLQTNLSLLQVNNWFINARRRILQPMLDASNPEQPKAKKNKTQNRPVQRFWPESIASIQPDPQVVQQISEAQKQGQDQREEQQHVIMSNSQSTTIDSLSPMLSQMQNPTPPSSIDNEDHGVGAEADLGLVQEEEQV